MKIAICDDLEHQLLRIKSMVKQYFELKQMHISIDTFQKPFDLLDAQANKPYDLVFLDICMPGLLGTEVAKEIRDRNDQTEIIFLTTSNEFAVDAFELNVAHYLLKPFTDLKLKEAIDRALSNMTYQAEKIISLKSAKGVIHAIDLHTIIYIEGQLHRQQVHFFDGTRIETVETLSELFNKTEARQPGLFFQPYKGFIVNHHGIARIESNQIVLKNNQVIPIPKRAFTKIKQTYFDFMFKERG